MTNEELKRLISKGYIPDNLPKSFSSETLSSKYDEYKSLLVENKALIPYKYDVYKKKFSTRQFTLLNPYNFTLLAKTMQDNWFAIEATLGSARLSLTDIVFADDEGSNVIKQLSKAQFQDTVFNRSSSMSVLLTTDITEHYDSTYTHSVSWAIHTKEQAKKLLKETHTGSKQDRATAKIIWDSMAGNILDRVIRDGDEQQTNGIPTGPATSRIISEVVLTAIDGELINELKANNIVFVGGRYVDDYELYFENERDADQALNVLREVLNKYKYKISEPKTYILSGPPIPATEEWKRRLRSVTPKALIDADTTYSVTEEQIKFSDLKHFMKDVVSLTREFDNPRVIKQVLSYPSSPLRKYKCPDDSWDLYEVYLLQLLANYPNTAKGVFDIIQNHDKGDSSKVATVLNKLLSSKNTTAFDTIWLLYGCLLFDVRLNEGAQEQAKRLNDPLIWLMLLHLKQRGDVSIDQAEFEAAWELYSLEDEGWLFKYEPVRQSWINDQQNVIQDDEFFNKLLQEDVTFYRVDKEEIELVEADWISDYDDAEIDENFEPDPDWLIESGR